MQFIATCKMGLESTVVLQLRQLGADEIRAQDARVFFSGNELMLARALLWLRTAERVLLVAGTFPAVTFDELFEGTKAVDWKRYLPRDAFIHVNGKSAKSTLFSVSDCQSIVKKAIVERLRQDYRTNVIPETGAEIIVEVGLLRDEATLMLDCCGAGLSRRGYRTWNVAAPLSETLGAGIVMLSQFHKSRRLIDPMCGSGTMPIEAAMIVGNRAPGLLREFAAEKWKFIPQGAFAKAREEARDTASYAPVEIEGSDIDARNIDICKKHAKKAGVMLQWAVRPVKDLLPEGGPGVIVCNPPYGERLLSPREVKFLYRDMRQVLDAAVNWQVSIIAADHNFERLYGKRANKRRKLSSGGMPCTLYQYE